MASEKNIKNSSNSSNSQNTTRPTTGPRVVIRDGSGNKDTSRLDDIFKRK